MNPAAASKESSRWEVHPAKSVDMLLRVAPICVAALAVCLYLTYGVERSLWLDEANSVLIAQGSPHQIVDALSQDVSPPLYYFFLSGWMRLFGNSEIALRIPSMLFYLAGIYVIWLAGRRLLGPEGGAVAAFLYAINPIAGRQAQNVRMYTMLSLEVAVSLVVFSVLVMDKERRTTRWFLLFGLISFIGLNTHYWFAFVLVAYACWVLATWRSWSAKELLLLGAVTVVPFAVVNLPMFLRQSRLPSTEWTPSPSVPVIFEALEVGFGLVPFHRFTKILFAAVLLAPILWAFMKHRCHWTRMNRHAALLLGCCYAISLAIPLLISFKRPIFYLGRYDIITVPYFVLLVGAALVVLPARPRLIFQLMAAVLCAGGFAYAVGDSPADGWLKTLDTVPLGDRTAAQIICNESAPGDFVIYTGVSRAAVSFYLQRLQCSQKVKEVSYPEEIEHHLGWVEPTRNYSREPAIRRQAEDAADLAYSLRARIFLLYDVKPSLSSGIVDAIKPHFRLLSSRKFSSCCWSTLELRLYAPEDAIKP